MLRSTDTTTVLPDPLDRLPSFRRHQVRLIGEDQQPRLTTNPCSRSGDHDAAVAVLRGLLLQRDARPDPTRELAFIAPHPVDRSDDLAPVVEVHLGQRRSRLALPRLPARAVLAVRRRWRLAEDAVLLDLVDTVDQLERVGTVERRTDLQQHDGLLS